MRIGIIGTGNVGSALAAASKRAGHDIYVSSDDRAEAEKLAGEVGAQLTDNRELIHNAEIVILAVPFDAVNDIVGSAEDELEGKVLVDVTNRFAAEELNGPSNAEQIQSMAPDSAVIKAINTIFAGNQDSPEVDGVQLDGFVAGDDEAGKGKVLEFVKSLGFRPIDVGPLAMARALEGMGTLNISLNMNNNWSWKSGWKLVGPLE